VPEGAVLEIHPCDWGNEVGDSPIQLFMPFREGTTWTVGGFGSYYGDGFHTNANNDYYATDWNKGTYSEPDLDSGEPVYPVAPGTILDIGISTVGYGNYVMIEHEQNIKTLYAHLLDLPSYISINQLVDINIQIGQVGKSGLDEFAEEHLHLGFYLNDNSDFGASLRPSPMWTTAGQWNLCDSESRTVTKYIATPTPEATSTPIATITPAATNTPVVTNTPTPTCTLYGNDPYADCVLEYHVNGASNQWTNPYFVLGAPSCGNWNFLALGGGGGYVVVDMGLGEEIVDQLGADLKVYEVGSGCGGVNETYEVYASNNPAGPWLSLGNGAGITTFDLPAELPQARYVKIIDPGGLGSGGTPGADIDAIEALKPGYSCEDDWEHWFNACSQSTASQPSLHLVSLSSDLNAISSSLQIVARDPELFYRVRDEIMLLTPEGTALKDLYYQHGPEIGVLLLAHPELNQEGLALLEYWEPKLQALVDGQGNTVVITQAEVEAVESFLANLEAVASTNLQTAIQNQEAELNLQGLVGMPMDQAWLYLNGFPSTPILDNFNRANGAIGVNWSGNPSKYSISSNQLLVTSNNSNSDIYWSGQAFGADQEVYVTFANVKTTATEQDLILKSQSNTTWGNGIIEVVYEAPANRVQVWTWEWPQGWVQHGADIPVTFVNGDTFGARALANGSVEVYKNGVLLGTRDVTSWSHYAQGGYVGLWFIGANGARLDDFGGGTISNGTQSLVAGAPSAGTIASADSFDAQVSGTSAFWQGIPLNETASVTIAQIRTNKQSLSPKPKSNGVWGEGVVQVFYDLANGRIQVWMYDSAKGWTQIGKDISVKFSVGDQFTVRTFADGRLEILRDGKPLATRVLTP
jgi:hypothetical protein